MQAGNRVAANTMFMYAKVLITTALSLCTTRLVLNLLGADDFGAFNLISGIVGMLAFFNTTVSVSIQRYMSHAMGMNDKERLAAIYRIAVKFSLLLGLLMVVCIEILAFFFFDRLNILPERMFAAKMVMHCMVLSTFFAVISLPYEAAIIAHEDLFVMSLLYILESLLKFGTAIYLIYAPFDKLIIYGILMAAIYINSCLIRRFYCKRKYEETHRKGAPSKQLFIEVAQFSAWTSLESFSGIFAVQWIAIMLNLFGGTVANAAYGIANQVNGQMLFFSATLLTAINPQIMKSEGSGDRGRTVRLSFFFCKVSFFLLALFSIPLLIEMPYVLNLWLKNVPENTVLFCRIVLGGSLISQLAYGLQCGIQAVGKIRTYQLVLFWLKIGLSLSVFLLLKAGFPIYSAVIYFVVIEIISIIVRMRFSVKILNIKLGSFTVNILLRLLCSFLLVYVFCSGLLLFMPDGFVRLVLVSIASVVASLLTLKWVVMTSQEYLQIRNILSNFITQIKNKMNIKKRLM